MDTLVRGCRFVVAATVLVGLGLVASAAAADDETNVPYGFMSFGAAYGRGSVESAGATTTNSGWGLSAAHVRLPLVASLLGEAFYDRDGWILTDFLEGEVHLGKYTPEVKRRGYTGTQQQIATEAAASNLWSSGHLGIGLQLHRHNVAVRGGYMLNYDRIRFSTADSDLLAGTADVLAHIGFVEGEIASRGRNSLALAVGNHWFVRGTGRLAVSPNWALQLSVAHVRQSYGSGANAASVLVTAGLAYMITSI